MGYTSGTSKPLTMNGILDGSNDYRIGNTLNHLIIQQLIKP